jgi:hypothetical protein
LGDRSNPPGKEQELFAAICKRHPIERHLRREPYQITS